MSFRTVPDRSLVYSQSGALAAPNANLVPEGVQAVPTPLPGYPAAAIHWYPEPSRLKVTTPGPLPPTVVVWNAASVPCGTTLTQPVSLQHPALAMYDTRAMLPPAVTRPVCEVVTPAASGANIT